MKNKWLLTLAATAMILPLAAPAQAQPRQDRGYNDRDRGRDNDRRDDRYHGSSSRDWQDRNGQWHRYGEWQDRNGKWHSNNGRWQRDTNWRNWSRYDYNSPDNDGYYYADRYYRASPSYRPIVVTRQTRIYRGSDNRYYCRRSDGTTGLIAGAAIGGVIGNNLDRGRSSVLGTILGAAAGAALGQSIDRGSVTCR